MTKHMANRLRNSVLTSDAHEEFPNTWNNSERMESLQVFETGARTGDLSAMSASDQLDVENVYKVAEFVIDELQTDVEQYFEKYPPNTEQLYTKHEPVIPDLHLQQIQSVPIPIPVKLNKGTQTQRMTLINKTKAEAVYRHMYPLTDDYMIQPPKISSRQASLQLDLEAAKQTHKNVDHSQIGPKVRWNTKPRILPPLPKDYHKIESFWTGSTYSGKFVNRKFDERGRFDYPLMSVYESEFHNGQIETKNHLGLVTYPRGDRFEGSWKHGRYIAGRITFADGLEFSPHDWHYMTPDDRRFYIEQNVGVKEAGRTLYNDRLPPPKIPPGCYDTGDGIYDSGTGLVTSFTGEILRVADVSEVNWILTNCRKSQTPQERYIPRFNNERLPCSYIIEKN